MQTLNKGRRENERHYEGISVKIAMTQGLTQRPVQQSFGRPIFSVYVEKYHQIPTNCILGGPQTPSGPTISKFGLPFIISWLSPCNDVQ